VQRRLHLSLTVLGVVVVLVTTPARAEPSVAPLPEDVAGLLADVERIVSVEQSLGWFVDRRGYEEVLPAVLQSVCRAESRARIAAREELRRRGTELGDSRGHFVRAGRKLDRATKDALFVERQLGALEHAMERAGTDCPYFVAPEPDFIGLQTDRNRFTLSLETGGMIQIRKTEGDWTFGGGGTARILPGWGFGGSFTLLAGAEFGGGAMIRPGVQPTQLAINYFPALPVVFRFRDVSWHYDLELAPVALFQADDQDLSFGARLGGTLGVAALRTRGFLPWAGLAVAAERYFESGGRAPATFFRGGLRVGVMWDP
jgi:hypothetical protein